MATVEACASARVWGTFTPEQSDDLEDTYIVQIPIIVQLKARKTKMIKNANRYLQNLLHKDI